MTEYNPGSTPFPAGFGPGTYGSSFADVYDRWYGGITDAGATARFMAARCTNPTVLELGVGTGRLASVLQVAGLRVIGIDSSREMLADFADGSGVLADISELPIRQGRHIGGALCAFNTLFNLPTADLQQQVLAQSAAAVDGPVVIEALTGAGLAQDDRQSVGVSRLTAESLVLAATVVDHHAQTVTGQHVEITESGIRLRPWHLRWSTPAQLDRMAGAIGLELVERYSTWDEDPFDGESDTHISVYRSTR